jgi:hypothetical protein
MNLIIYGYDAIGDWISVNGLIRYLLKYYSNIHIITNHISLCTELYRNNSNIIINNINNVTNTTFDELSFGIWGYCEKCYNVRYCFNRFNKIGNFYNIVCQNITSCLDEADYKSNYSHILSGDSIEYENNSSAFYLGLGIPSNIKLDYFYFERNLSNEDELYSKLKLKDNEFSVICEYDNNIIEKNKIKNKNIINIHNISNFFDIIKIIENASEVHLIENSVALFIYHMQYKNLMKNVNICLHTYARQEIHRKVTKNNPSNMYLDMLLKPKLENWEIINCY